MNQTKPISKRKVKPTVVTSELQQKIWAVIDGKKCYLKNVTYLKASEKVKTVPGSFVVTNKAASRLIK